MAFVSHGFQMSYGYLIENKGATGVSLKRMIYQHFIDFKRLSKQKGSGPTG
jgi:hypothetical protein